ncbi:hypothetical protein [Alicyclobacillus sp. ALC3]|uniref:hypothetical protein n=1 Tax=Alicyclobacillus sp. ALC3 TaxID=2796143 RepID=UPI0023787BBD|nr:hypothetical protein [Alicyclobacillus sp. ALC3]WDL96373.1 hypothetical protein JC200_18915 [Alicyclobacillus sp. ALC3]
MSVMGCLVGLFTLPFRMIYWFFKAIADIVKFFEVISGRRRLHVLPWWLRRRPRRRRATSQARYSQTTRPAWSASVSKKRPDEDETKRLIAYAKMCMDRIPNLSTARDRVIVAQRALLAMREAVTVAPKHMRAETSQRLRAVKKWHDELVKTQK